MGLIVRKVQGGAQDRIRSLVAEHAETLEPGLTVLETSLRLGRATIDVVALDAKQTLVLVVAADVPDEKVLVSTLDAYVWCLAFPENVKRLYPAVSIGSTRPPRVIFVAERIPDAFMELVERMSAVHVECQELHSPSPTAAPQPVERKTVTPSAAPVAPVVSVAPVAAAPVTPARAPAPARYIERAPVAAGFDAGVASQWESFLSDDAAPAAAAPAVAEVPVTRIAFPAAVQSTPPASQAASNGHANGHTNGHASSSANGHAPIAAAAPAQPVPSPSLAQAMRAAEASIEHAAVNLGAAPVTESSAAQPAASQTLAAPPSASAPAAPSALKSAAPAPQAKPTAPEAPAANHPALESLKFPKGGVSRQWQDFLDQLAAATK
jgi:hypothetical protein